MEKKLLIVAIVVVGLCGTALALDPMGPPKAGLQEGQWSAGAEYSRSEMDIKAIHGRYTYDPYAFPSFDITDMEMDKCYANIGYGISDKWDVFLRLGIASDEGEIGGVIYDPYPGSFDGGSAFAWGFGTKVTFHESDLDLTWGALAQVSFTELDGDFKLPTYTLTGDVEIELIEAQFAVGPTFKAAEGISVYGGPFLHFVDGEFETRDDDGEHGIYDLEEQTFLGVYVGTLIELSETTDLSVEYQKTADAWALAGGITFRF